jgi:hypothetical protein
MQESGSRRREATHHEVLEQREALRKFVKDQLFADLVMQETSAEATADALGIM